MKHILFFFLLGGFLPATGLAATAADFSGTWSGRFQIHFPDGRVADDTAWVVLQHANGALSGTAGPKPEQQAPIREVSVTDATLNFVADSTQGKVLRFALKREGDGLSGEAHGEIGEDRVRVVLDLRRQEAAAASQPDDLRRRLLALDTAMFDAFNACADPVQLEKHAAFFAPDAEFYHDVGGLSTGAATIIASTRKNVCGKIRRELDTGSFRAFPIPGYGAITTGTHRFCHTPTTCEGVAEFTIVWREKDGVWQITRALSFAHRSIEGNAAKN